MSYLSRFFLCFIPLFVAIDIMAAVPFFIVFTEGMDLDSRHRLATQASLTALIISLIFLVAGRLLFTFLGITAADFQIAGGILLLAFSIVHLNASTPKVYVSEVSAGVVPLGIPLTIGPAALTTILILLDSQGLGMTFLALILNLAIVLIVFWNSDAILRLLGKSGTAAIGRIMQVFLAAIAIMMIRLGITHMLQTWVK